MISTLEPAVMAQTSAVTEDHGDDDFDDSLVQVRPPHVPESLADMTESLEPAVADEDEVDGDGDEEAAEPASDEEAELDETEEAEGEDGEEADEN